MQYHRIHIIGGPGSGKTYISQKLQGFTSLTAFDLDEVFWDQSQNSYIRSSEESRAEKLNLILSKEKWIIEGVYYKWLDVSFKNADIIIILNPPLIKRQWRILKRFFIRKFFLGPYRKETFKNFKDLWRWNRNFDDDNMVRINEFISQHKEKIVYCSSYKEVVGALNA